MTFKSWYDDTKWMITIEYSEQTKIQILLRFSEFDFRKMRV